MKSVLKIFILAIVLLSCRFPHKLPVQQGIKGRVIWLEGNLMPTIGEDTLERNANGRPVQRTIFIHAPTTREQVVTGESGVLYNQIKSRLIKKIETTKSGMFKVNLPEGKYSVFVLEESGYFASTFDGEGTINPVTVEPEKYTEIVIEINYKAFY